MADNQLIYLDNNATTRIDPRVLEIMLPFLQDSYSNASSHHLFGYGSSLAVAAAREQVAELFGASPAEIFFTSGATESINLVIKGIAATRKGRHIITLTTEHPAVLDTCKSLEKQGYEVSYLPVQPSGLLDPELLKQELRADTLLVCIMQVNNETGVIQPVEQLAAITHAAGALFFSDTTQAAGKIPLNMPASEIDILCFSAHKFYGPKGVGGIYIRNRKKDKINLAPLFHGGGHERGMRSGTLNVPGIAGLGMAAALAKNELAGDTSRIGALRDHLEQELLKIPGSSVNGSRIERVANTTNLYLPNPLGLDRVMELSCPVDGMPLIALSNGSACKANSTEPSHVLTAMGLNDEQASSSLRISLGRFTSIQEIENCVQAFTTIFRSESVVTMHL